MAAFVTDQFRILNASNFIDSISDSNNSYYAFLGLANPTSVGFGRTSDWNTNTPNPIDNFRYLSHYRDTALFGKKITESNAVRVVRKIEWIQNSPYDMYRHDYDNNNQAPVSKSYRLYDANYYVITSAFRVYICIDNGSSGTTNPKASIVEPTQTTPNVQKEIDGYSWKYLFSINPSDIIKFDSTEYIPLPNNWETNPDTQIVRESGNPEISNNQIKKVFIKNGGSGYSPGKADILGDGEGGEVDIEVDSNGTITNVTVDTGGKNYTYGVIDFSDLGSNGSNGAELIPIIPPSIGHGYDIYKELGADKVLLYTRFDDSNRDFPSDTQFSQIGVLKNPVGFQTTSVLQSNTFSSLYAAVLTTSPILNPGDEMTQVQTSTSSVAKGYVASFDPDTKVLKYFQDRSLVFGNGLDQSDNPDITNLSPFNSTDSIDISGEETNLGLTVDTTVNNTSIITVGSNQIDTGVQFSSGLANPEINKKTGDILYVNNRPVVERSPQQKEDIKIILEF